MCVRHSDGLDQGGSSDGAERKLDSRCNLVVKSTAFAFRVDAGFRGKKESRLTLQFLA